MKPSVGQSTGQFRCDVQSTVQFRCDVQLQFIRASFFTAAGLKTDNQAFNLDSDLSGDERFVCKPGGSKINRCCVFMSTFNFFPCIPVQAHVQLQLQCHRLDFQCLLF